MSLKFSKTKLITGPPQSGKTAKLCECVKECIKTTNVIIVVRNLNTDKLQLVNKLKKLINTDLFKSSAKFENNKNNSILVIQWNKTQIGRVIANVTKKFCLFTDESDDIGYKQRSVVSDLYEELKLKAIGHYEVTATPWDVLYGNEELCVDNIINVTPPSSFRGIDNYDFEEYSVSNKQDLEEYIEDYYTNKMNDEIPQSQPIIILHRDGNRQNNHTKFIRNIATDSCFNKTYTVIVEDGRGYQLFCPLFTKFEGVINIKGNNYIQDSTILNYYSNITSNNIDIQELLQWLKNLDIGISHIIIKTGNQAGRSRSYVSSDGQWHLTHQFLYNSRDVPIPDLIQSLRLSHTLGGNIRLELTAQRKVISDIKKGNEAINKALEILQNCKDSSKAKEKLLEIKWSVEEIPKANLCKSSLHKGLNKDMVKKARMSIEGKYTIIDIARTGNTKLRRGLEYLYNKLDKVASKYSKITLDVDKVNKTILLEWYKMDGDEDKSRLSETNITNKIHGAIWTPIRTTSIFEKSNKPMDNYINYYKDGNGNLRILYQKT